MFGKFQWGVETLGGRSVCLKCPLYSVIPKALHPKACGAEGVVLSCAAKPTKTRSLLSVPGGSERVG